MQSNLIKQRWFMQHLTYWATYSVLPINSPLLNITLYSSDTTTLIYHDTEHSAPVMMLQLSSAVQVTQTCIHSFSILSDDSFKASSKTIPPHSEI